MTDKIRVALTAQTAIAWDAPADDTHKRGPLRLVRPTLRERFEVFHATNPHVYRLFERFALEAARSGRRRFGAKAVWERMRWFVAFETTADDWKLNNSHTAYYAREFIRRHPEHADLFETRERAK